MSDVKVDSKDNYALVPGDPKNDAPPKRRYENLDGFQNELTGLGDFTRDKTLGGRPGGPLFDVNFLSGIECENLWRGSDLGARIVETLPDEMIREGWEISVQPEDEDDLDKAQEIVEAIDAKQQELDTRAVFRQALRYERAYGGAGILIGVQDGEKDLAKPLDEARIKSITHLTPYRGGWDGELIAWSTYGDPRAPKYGQPEIYLLRNLGVPLNSNAPGAQNQFFIHESRLLIFTSSPVSYRAQNQMRGWGDSVFTRTKEVLSQYGQTWNALAILMQEWSLGVPKVEGLAEMLSSNDPSSQGAVANRAVQLQMSQSIAKARIIDSTEDFRRDVSSLAGVADVLNQFALRVAASADMPLSLLMGQTQGGLGDAGNTDLRFFYDRVSSRQESKLLPQIRRLTHLQFLSKDGPTKGAEPKKWHVECKPLWQPTAQEEANYRKIVAETDAIYLANGVVDSNEIAASRYGGSKYSAETVLDNEARTALKVSIAEPGAEQPNAEQPAEQPAEGAPAESKVELTATDLGIIVTVNEARKSLGLDPIPGGDLTIAEFKAKNEAVIAKAANAEAGITEEDKEKKAAQPPPNFAPKEALPEESSKEAPKEDAKSKKRGRPKKSP